MWERQYKDYKKHESSIKNQVESGRGIVGAEMHDINGWGESFHRYRRPAPTLLRTLWSWIFKSKY